MKNVTKKQKEAAKSFIFCNKILIDASQGKADFLLTTKLLCRINTSPFLKILDIS